MPLTQEQELANQEVIDALEKLLKPPAASVAVVKPPVWETPAHEEIDRNQFEYEDADLIHIAARHLTENPSEKVVEILVEEFGISAEEAGEFIKEGRKLLLQTKPETLEDWALNAVYRGMFVIPCDPNGKQPAGEAVPHSVKNASNDPKVIRLWWARNPQYNPAIALEPSSLTVYDYDTISERSDYVGLSVKSGRDIKEGRQGGFHHYYRGLCPTVDIIVDAVKPYREESIIDGRGESHMVSYDALDRIVDNDKVSGGEYRSRGSYVVWAGAVHPSGRRYEIVQDNLLPLSTREDKKEEDTSDPAVGTDLQNEIAEMIETAFAKTKISHGQRKSHNQGFMWLIDCPWMYLHSRRVTVASKDSSSAVIMRPSGKLGYECKHTHCLTAHKWKELRAWMDETNEKLNGPKAPYLKFGKKENVALEDRYKPLIMNSGMPSLAAIQNTMSETENEYSEYALSDEEMELEFAKPYPVIPLKEQAGPYWDDSVLYGPAGDLIRKASEYNEAHPAGMYLDFLVSIGNVIGRHAYFNVNQTKHYANENLARVGVSAESRKGSGRDTIDEVLKLIAPDWYANRIMSGFGSAEAIVGEMRDTSVQQIRIKPTRGMPKGPEFKMITVPGIEDKRLCIRESELASIFLLASKQESRADIVIRDGWDGKPLRNLVKGRGADGLSNSAVCMEPHLSISGDTTRSELLKKMPDGADENGFGNRFLYCYVYRTKMCPLGGPPIDWSKELVYFHEVIEWGKNLKYVPLTSAAEQVWKKMYTLDILKSKLPGIAGKMTARAEPHIRRIALIYAIIDKMDVVDSKHLQAAKRIWNYCQDSAGYTFRGTTRDQERILRWIRTNGAATAGQIRRGLFHDNKRSEWVQSQLMDLVQKGRLKQSKEVFSIVTDHVENHLL